MKDENLFQKIKNQNNHFVIIGLFFTAFIVRFLWILDYQSSPLFDYPLMDFTFFNQRAHSILQGNFFSENYLFNPLYPLFLVIIYPIFGFDLFMPRVIQALLGSWSVILVFSIANHLMGRRVAVISAIFTCFYLPLIYFDGILMATTLITFLVLSVAYLCLRSIRSNNLITVFFSGLLLGLVYLGRPNFILVGLLLSVWISIFITTGAWSRRLAAGAVLWFTSVLVISPITISHWMRYKEFIIVAPHGGINFYIGNNPQATGTYMSIPGVSNLPGQQVIDSREIACRELGRSLSASEVSKYWIGLSKSYFRNKPLGALKLYLRKICLYWNSAEIPSEYSLDFDRQFHRVLRLPLFTFGFVGPLGLMGLFLVSFLVFRHGIKHLRRGTGCSETDQRDRLLSLLLLIVLGMKISVILFFVHARYRLPVAPWICILAGIFVNKIYWDLKSRKIYNLSLSLIGLVFAITLCNLPLVERNDLPGYYNLANAHYQAGNKKQAETILLDILEQSESEKTRYLLGQVQFDLNKMKSAGRQFRKILSTNPGNYNAALNLGNVFYNLKEYEKSKTMFNYCLKLDESRFDAYINLVVLYHETGDKEKALETLELLDRLKLSSELKEIVINFKKEIGTGYQNERK